MAFASRGFAGWLRQQKDPALGELPKRASGAEWTSIASLEEALLLIDSETGLSAAERDRLKAQASLAYLRFPRARRASGRVLGLTAFGLGVFLFMASILAILAVAIFEPVMFRGSVDPQGTVPPLLTRLADIETARGLITFVFTVGVIALALIIVTANVTSNDEEASQFERSKEILTSMIAILGTILGFYFGKADSGSPDQPAAATAAQPAAETPPVEATEAPPSPE